MINDLSVKDFNDLWKYVDDSSLSESVCSDGSSNLQKYVDEFNQKSTADGFQINKSKCKEFCKVSHHPHVSSSQLLLMENCQRCNIGKIAGSNHLK